MVWYQLLMNQLWLLMKKKKIIKSSFETENKSKYFQNELQSFNYLINRGIYLGLDDMVL